jgi:hypothetical protein
MSGNDYYIIFGWQIFELPVDLIYTKISKWDIKKDMFGRTGLSIYKRAILTIKRLENKGYVMGKPDLKNEKWKYGCIEYFNNNFYKTIKMEEKYRIGVFMHYLFQFSKIGFNNPEQRCYEESTGGPDIDSSDDQLNDDQLNDDPLNDDPLNETENKKDKFVFPTTID